MTDKTTEQISYGKKQGFKDRIEYPGWESNQASGQRSQEGLEGQPQDMGLVPWLLRSPSTWLHKPWEVLPRTYREFVLFEMAATAPWALSAYAHAQRFLPLRNNLAESHTSLLLNCQSTTQAINVYTHSNVYCCVQIDRAENATDSAADLLTGKARPAVETAVSERETRQAVENGITLAPYRYDK